MQITADEGALLTMLVRLTGGLNAVEVGTFTGYSSICIARGLAEGGRLLACDVSGEWTDLARRYWERAGVTDRIEPTAGAGRGDTRGAAHRADHRLRVRRRRQGELPHLLRGAGEPPAPGRPGRPRQRAARRPRHRRREQGERVTAMRAVNDRVAADDRVDAVMLPVRDGVTVARRRYGQPLGGALHVSPIWSTSLSTDSKATIPRSRSTRRPRPRRRTARGRRGRARSSRPGGPDAVEGRVRPDADRGRADLAGVQPLQPAGVDAVGRDRGQPVGGTLAVGKPRSRPRWSPRTTTPSRRTGGPAPRPRRPRRRRPGTVRTYVDDQTIGPPSSGDPLDGEAVLGARSRAASRRRPRPAAEPEVRAHHDGRGVQACRRARAGRTPPGVQRAISRSNGSTSTWSAPASASSSARALDRRQLRRRVLGRAAPPSGAGRTSTATHRQPSSSADLPGAVQHHPVTAVHAVEVADDDDGAARGRTAPRRAGARSARRRA